MSPAPISVPKVNDAFWRWAGAMEDRRREGISSCYTPDAVIIGPDGQSTPAQNVRHEILSTAEGVVRCRIGSPSFVASGKDVLASFTLDEKMYHGCIFARYEIRQGQASLRFRLIRDRWLIVEEKMVSAISGDGSRDQKRGE